MILPRLVVFDWDGTLVDSVERIVTAWRGACASLGLPCADASAIREGIGPGLARALPELLPEVGDAARTRFAARLRENLALAAAGPAPLLDGAAQTLRALAGSGVMLAIATGMGRQGLDRELRAHGLCRLFDASRCAEESVPKPAPGMLLEVLAETGTAPTEALMVGDTGYDIEMAMAAGVDAVGVCSGVHDAPRLRRAGAVAVLDDVGDLLQWLRERH